MVKDLRNLGRDMKRVIIIDDTEENFSMISPLNGITVPSWQNDMSD
jgi:TFIIF-interacting CTD phosphatase-like protein